MPIRSLSRLLVVLSLAAGLLAEAGPARGTSFPGNNGKIAFALNGEIKTVNPDGSGLATLATAGGSSETAWSADGKEIAYRAGAPTFGIAAVKQDGTGQRQITTTNGDSEPAWSPDSTKIAFTRPNPTADLMVANSDGTGVTNLTTTYDPSVSAPQWSPQGDKIAFSGGGTSLQLIDAGGGTPQPLFTSFDTRAITWSPDGQKLVYNHGPTEIWMVNRDGSDNHMIAGGFSQVNEISWGPDGTKIALNPNVVATPHLLMMNPDGSNQQDLGIVTGATFDWQPRPVADLQVTKADAPDPVNVGQNVTYTITVTNAGPHPAFSAKLVDTLPPGVTFVSANATKGTCSGTASVTCQIGWLASGEVSTVTIVVTANSVGSLSNTATVSHVNLDPDPNLQNNTVTETTRVFDPGDLLKLTKSDSPDPVLPGQNITYTITVENIGGGSAADAVTVTDALPGSVSFVSSTTSTGSCTGTATVECTLGSMALGDTVEITIVVKANTEGTVTNTATVATTTTDPKPSNNSDTATTRVGKTATTITLAVTKTATKWKGKGAVTPPVQGEKVTVTWYKKTGKTFKKLSSTSGTIDAQGAYSSSRKRSTGGSCKATARYPGDTGHKPSTKTKTFTC